MQPSNNSFRISPSARLERPSTGLNLAISLLIALLVTLVTFGIAKAQDETAPAQQVEVPQSLSPEAMQTLVSNLDEEQTAALVQLMDLIHASAGQQESSTGAGSMGVVEIVTLAGSRLYTSMADDDAVIDDALDRFETVFRRLK